MKRLALALAAALTAALLVTGCAGEEATPAVDPATETEAPMPQVTEPEADATAETSTPETPAPSSAADTTDAPDTATSEERTMYLTVNGNSAAITPADTEAAAELLRILADGPVTVSVNDYGNFEKVGALGFSLPTSDTHINTAPGDVILYQGSNICLYYGTNSWSFTRLGHIDGLTEAELRTLLAAGEGTVSITLSLQ